MAGPRSKVLNNLRNLAVGAVPKAKEATDHLDTLDPGYMQIHSFFEPSLKGGTYKITVSQTATYNQLQDLDNSDGPEVTVTDAPLTLPDPSAKSDNLEQRFKVVVPRFSIDNKKFHSCYPPQGHADQPNVLPHIVFNDSHLPWAISISESTGGDLEDMMPWLAIFPFDCARDTDPELRLTDAQLKYPTAVYQKKNADGTSDTSTPLQQSSTFTISMTVAEYLTLPQNAATNAGTTPIHIPPFASELDKQDYADMLADTSSVEVIFMTFALFKKLFPIITQTTTHTTGATGGVALAPGVSASSGTNPPGSSGATGGGATAQVKYPDTSSFRYLTHIRNVNTSGTATTSASGGEDSGVFSVVHSRRTGPTDVAQGSKPRPQTVHVLSLELLDKLDVTNFHDDELIAFVSLYRWIYLCQPPQTVNFVDSMRAVGNQVKRDSNNGGDICALRAPRSVRDSVSNGLTTVLSSHTADMATRTDSVRSAMVESTNNRLQNGYTLVRYRSPSGQETVAWNRGPLSPTPTPSTPTSNWPFASNNGQDYQIFDKATGLLDLSYSSAWQTGKLMGGSDQGFSAALIRHRAYLHSQGASAASQVKADLTVGTKTTVNTVSNMNATIQHLHALSSFISGPHQSLPDLTQRWSHNSTSQIKTSVEPQVQAAFVAGVKMAGQASASQKDADPSNPIPHNELSPAASTDWEIIHNWVLDKMYLSNIPAHALVGDPSYLPLESIRFFHIDRTWIECFIDGALSVANHMASDDDVIRHSIKTELNSYFGSLLATTDGEHYPQVPKWGFFLRSAVVDLFTDLIVQVPYALVDSHPEINTSFGRSPVLVQKHLAKDILLVLLDRTPEQIGSIYIQQPPHQQRFTAGDALDNNQIEFLLKKVFPPDTGSHPDFLHPLGETHTFSNPLITTPDPTKVPTNPPKTIYDWTTQCLDLDYMANWLFNTTTGIFATEVEWTSQGGNAALTSSIVALELNDPVQYLEIISNIGLVSFANSDDAIKAVPTTAYELRIQGTQSLINNAVETLQEIKDRNTPATPAVNRTGSNPLVLPIKATPPLAGSTLLGQPIQFPPLPPQTNPPPKPDPNRKVPQFEYAVYPSTTPYPGRRTDASFVFVDTPFVADLVFSINILPAARLHPQGLYLKEIDIRIPLGSEARRRAAMDRSKPQNTILGPGLCPDNAAPATRARMLSNQRWVVHMSLEGDPYLYLVLRVIPRTLDRAVPVEINRNLSFMLHEVDVTGLTLPTPPKDGKGTGQKVTIAVVEVLASLKSLNPVMFNDMGQTSSLVTVARRVGWKQPVVS